MKKHTENSAFAKKLVIDASIARAAGSAGQALNPSSKKCRDFLLAMRRAKHFLVRTREIDEEWAKHESTFAKEWRASMVQKGYYCIVREAINHELREKIGNASVTLKEIKAMLKDVILIEAALSTDKAIASLDEHCREPFAKASVGIPELADITWVNPDRSEENPIYWLK